MAFELGKEPMVSPVAETGFGSVSLPLPTGGALPHDEAPAPAPSDQTGPVSPKSPPRPPNEPASYVSTRARIAIYDDLLSSPRIIEVGPAPVLDFIEAIASTTYSEARALGGSLPYAVIREIAENFIHAAFKECTVSLLDKGATISFSDQGPGIEKKHLVQQPGVSSATAEMKRFIKGVGSGFPIVKEYLRYSQGHLSITDNARDGTVVTLSTSTSPAPGAEASFLATAHTGLETDLPSFRVGPAAVIASPAVDAPLPGESRLAPKATPGGPSQEAAAPLSLSMRELHALQLIAELGAVGPNDLAERLGLSAPTLSRLLKDLERRGFVELATRRKRILSNAGLQILKEAGRW